MNGFMRPGLSNGSLLHHRSSSRIIVIPRSCENSKSVPMDARGFRHEIAGAGIMPGYEFRGAPSASEAGVCACINPLTSDLADDRLQTFPRVFPHAGACAGVGARTDLPPGQP